MPRQPRFCSETGIYHVMMRGNAKRDIFLDQNDGKRFINTLLKVQRENQLTIYAFCLMRNHFHILCKEGTEPLSATMKRIAVAYAKYFNEKYERVGHLFQGRFLSQPVAEERYLLAVVRYIHNNPCKAHLVQAPKDYRWSSYHVYARRSSKTLGKAAGMRAHEGQAGLVDTDFILSMFQEDTDAAVDDFIEFMTQRELGLLEDEEIESAIMGAQNKEATQDRFGPAIAEKLAEFNLAGGLSGEEIDPHYRDAVIYALKQSIPISMRQLAECLGIGKDIVARACRSCSQDG